MAKIWLAVLFLTVGSMINTTAQEKTSTITIICSAIDQQVIDNLQGPTLPGSGGYERNENMEGYCYGNIVNQIRANLAPHGFDISLIQTTRAEMSAHSTPTASFHMFTDVYLDGAPQVILITTKQPQMFAPSNLLSANRDNQIVLWVVGDEAKTAAGNLSTGIILFSLGECELAPEYFEKALAADFYIGTDPYIWVKVDILFYQANCAILEKQYSDAEEYFESANKLMGDERSLLEIELQTNLAWTYLQQGRETDAFQLMDRVVTFNKEWGTLWAQAISSRAQFYGLAERYDDAIYDLTAAIELPAENTSDLYILRGQMYLALYEWDSALADYNMAIELDPEYADAYYERGVLYYSILQTGVELRTDALADFQKYLELTPDGEKADDAARYVEQIETELEALNG